jgi:hypothetical protein
MMTAKRKRIATSNENTQSVAQNQCGAPKLPLAGSAAGEQPVLLNKIDDNVYPMTIF